MKKGGGHSYSHAVHGITHTHTHAPLLLPGCSMCCGLSARHASSPRVAHTVAHTCPCHHHHRVDACLAVCPLPLLLRCVLSQRGERRGEAVRPRCHDRCGGGVAGCEQHVPCWHQQTIQHSKGKGGGRGGAATRTACERDTPSSPSATSLGLLARGR